MIPTFPGPRPGFTLIEMVLVLAGLGIAFLIGTTVLLATVRVDEVNSAANQRLAARAALADQFRIDVAGATSVPDRLEKLTAGPTCLLLRTATGKHIVYRWQDGRLERSESPAPATPRPVGPGRIEIEFTRPDRDGKLVTMTLRETRKAPRPPTPFVVTAALGGDRR